MKLFYNKTVSYSINFSEEKNQLLKTMRGVSFDEVEKELENNNFIKNIRHFNKKRYSHQFMFLIYINNYVYVVPYVINKEKKEIYLKTLYPNRKFTKLYKKTRKEK